MNGPLISLLAILVGLAIVGVAIWLFVRMLRGSKEMTCPTCGESLGAKYWTRPDMVCPNCGSHLDRPPTG